MSGLFFSYLSCKHSVRAYCVPGPGIDVGDVTVNQGLGVRSVKDGLMTDGKSYRGAVLGVRERMRSSWTHSLERFPEEAGTRWGNRLVRQRTFPERRCTCRFPTYDPISQMGKLRLKNISLSFPNLLPVIQ